MTDTIDITKTKKINKTKNKCKETKNFLCLNINCQDCFNKSFATRKLAKLWSDKNELKPFMVLRKSDKEFIFYCKICDHEFNKKPHCITDNTDCPYCFGSALCINNSCNFCFNRSFASHEKSKYLSPNNLISPRNITISSSIKLDFICNICNHTFNSAVDEITGHDNTWCPYCANKKLCNNESCILCYNKSFASHEKAKYWSSLNTCTSRDVCMGAKKMYKFNCSLCKHEILKELKSIKRGEWCPYCAIPSRILCSDDNCEHCFQRSFASHPKSVYWSDNNDKTPREVFKNSGVKYKFICGTCEHEFASTLTNINQGDNWCPFCNTQTETIVYDFLKRLYPNTIFQFKNPTCKFKNELPFDYCIPDYNIIIELDGYQHFKQCGNWVNVDFCKQRDKDKQQWANNNNYSTIRLMQNDVWFNRYDWKTELINNINKINSEKKIQNIYMCKNNEYHHFTI